ncbi:TPA: hypothetical protein NIB84_005855 [Pseudomonas aeruginosa]|nr:hypothetical protein [Pseudomonas aeruginosa]HCE7551392.1 hypothetical protein [Pseudomonas aeruginosa]HCE7578490.1 hypothetical protein [Pseudomonas aeruginosa]HCE7849798.1 hypothetical protein [Pseudomonas aeruginosa]HCE7924186.1 hypothetical protein [Pseudomonas aeruginosa]
MVLDKKHSVLMLINLAAVILVCYFLSLNFTLPVVLTFFVYLVSSLERSAINKLCIWMIFLAPQAISIAYNYHPLRGFLTDAHSGAGQFNWPYFGVQRTLDILEGLGLNNRVSSIAGAVEASIVVMLVFISPLMRWSLLPASGEASASSLHKLSMTFLFVWFAVVLLLAVLPLHSAESCVRRCSNIAASNIPRLNLLFFAQSLLLVLPAIFVRCQITANARSKHV